MLTLVGGGAIKMCFVQLCKKLICPSSFPHKINTYKFIHFILSHAFYCSVYTKICIIPSCSDSGTSAGFGFSVSVNENEQMIKQQLSSHDSLFFFWLFSQNEHESLTCFGSLGLFLFLDFFLNQILKKKTTLKQK